VGDLGVQRRDRDPLVTDDSGGTQLDRAARGHHERGADNNRRRRDKPPKHRITPLKSGLSKVPTVILSEMSSAKRMPRPPGKGYPVSAGHAHAAEATPDGRPPPGHAPAGRPSSTARMPSPHQASSSVSRNGCPPMGAVFGTGTSIVRTACLSTVFGYRRYTGSSGTGITVRYNLD